MINRLVVDSVVLLIQEEVPFLKHKAIIYNLGVRLNVEF